MRIIASIKSQAPLGTFSQKRVGRGIGSGKGKTAGRGHKGQRARSKVRRFFEGGQTPLRISVPKRGFINAHKRELNYVNIDRILQLIQVGRIDASKPITLKTLYDARVFKKLRDGLKLLGRGGGDVAQPLYFQVTAVSDTAKDSIEQAGGKVVKTYYNELGLRALCKVSLEESLSCSLCRQCSKQKN